MIELGDIYKVIEAMVPLYVALTLGYGSVRWWHIFTPEQCEAINHLVAYFTLPFYTFQFTLNIDPFAMNYHFILADCISKLIIVLVLAAWVKCSSKGNFCWTITSYSLSNLTNSLIVGIPLLNAMYGKWSQDLVVQSSVFQAIVWLTLLLFVFEVRESYTMTNGDANSEQSNNNRISNDDQEAVKDVEANGEERVITRPSFWTLMKIVWIKLALNPNSYASIIGITWAFISNRWHIPMPEIFGGSVLIMAKAGTGMAMFSMGLFMAQQKNIIACGPRLTIFGMVLRFIAGPAAMAIGSLIVGLHGDILRVAIIQAALPQSITSFIYAREYGLHADVLSTAVIFGMLVSLPVLVAYYVLLGFMS